MNVFQSIFLALNFFVTACCFSQEIPETEISNGLVTAKLYLPDSINGYYRATRFDWSGIISHLEYSNHSYFGKWFKNYDPLVHESVMGPAESFSPIGYDDANVGEEFLKIGVGTLLKPSEEKYIPFRTYTIKNHGIWTIKKKSNEVIFNHQINSTQYSYNYTKNVKLTKNKPELILHHKIRNTGNKTIKTQVFNHNFFFIDQQPIGEGYVIKFPYKIIPIGRQKGIPEFAKISMNEIDFTDEIPEGKQVYVESLSGFDQQSNQYEFSIENRKSGANVKVVGDSPLAKMVFWSAHKTVCPEPYINIEVKPGETINWNITYTFNNFSNK